MGSLLICCRYPIRLPSDMQKVTAVDRPELFPWPDVIIASTKGSRSLASLLSGGGMSLWAHPFRLLILSHIAVDMDGGESFNG